jgi:hypothetical protein
MRTAESTIPRTHIVSCEDQDLCRRICAEFGEMPGLALTLAQASRLFHLDVSKCERVLEALVRDGVLAQRGCMFRRPGGVRTWD